MASVNVKAGKKRKLADEKRVFNEAWTNRYFVIEHNNAALCVICHETIAVQKEYNVKRHYTTKHAKFDEITGQARANRVAALRKNVAAQQNVFKKANNDVRSVTRLSYVLAEQLAKKMQPFSNGDLIKNCIGLFVDAVCPQHKAIASSLCLSRNTVARRVTDISTSIESTLKQRVATFQSYAIAVDESTDIKDMAQLAIFVRGVDKDITVTEELLALPTLKDTTTGRKWVL